MQFADWLHPSGWTIEILNAYGMGDRKRTNSMSKEAFTPEQLHLEKELGEMRLRPTVLHSQTDHQGFRPIPMMQ
uniref:Putative uncharacterized protein encoded by LINC00587 n=1 Tax=Homo sapiens TaxID=9606 RepID=CI107_HUMAN|nr:RecName: Full=Putative uncharacterized protein encoded by LINC00587 [Homo sapiens]